MTTALLLGQFAVLAAALGACRSAPSPRQRALDVAPAIRVSGQDDRVEVAVWPELAIGQDGMLVAWENEHREGTVGDRIVVRRLSRAGEP